MSAKFRLGVITGTLAILLVYAFDLILYLFGVPGLHFPHQTGQLGIASSIFIVIIAALNLVLDFDLIESGAREGAPQYMEWYCAFGLMVTLVWLYLEILELLIRIYASSDDMSYVLMAASAATKWIFSGIPSGKA